MEFLFENPFILFIIIGIISSLFKKKNENEQQKQRPTRKVSPQSQEPVETFEDRQETVTTVYEADPHVPTEPVTIGQTENEMSDIQRKYDEWKRKEAEERYKEVSPSIIGSNDMQTKEKVSLQLKPEADRLIEGIAWAQVLGPPRAKNPHRTMRR